MKALKIDTANRKVEVIEISSWQDIAPAIGNGCTTFAAPVVMENDDTLYVDDEGIFNGFEGGFKLEDSWQYPILGNAILQGTDEEGDSIEPKTTKEELEAMIIWVDKAECEKWAANFH